MYFLAFLPSIVKAQQPTGHRDYIPNDQTNIANTKTPLFTPPGSNIAGFQCDYTKYMPDWERCDTATSKSCWLRKGDGTDQFDIRTDYENRVPVGTDRYYTLVLEDKPFNADGKVFLEGKLINGTFPGPLIEACWGDRVHITVINDLNLNGTSIHWHGIRQNQTMHMDGVNGVTQCPMAPGDQFTYSWNATQYGSSWYHSHYSVQYADGVQAPITIHGPSSANYDTAIEPLIMTDWGHNSAFQQIYTFTADLPSILLNGLGNITRWNASEGIFPSTPRPYEVLFKRSCSSGKPCRYLLRIINTSFSTSFIFSIDNHYLQVVEADFVPIRPYTTTYLNVAIGQRYNVIVVAQPSTSYPAPGDGNFWIRTFIGLDCSLSTPGSPGYERVGILRYSANSKSDPSSTSWPTLGCSDDTVCILPCVDEDVNSLVPIVPWEVGNPPVNGPQGEGFNVSTIGDATGQFGTAFFSLERFKNTLNTPMQVNYGNPTFLHLDNQAGIWPVGWMVVPENYTATDWVWLVLNSEIGSHPMHLHGHDFAVLQVSTTPYIGKLDPKTDNPARRDVILLPKGGFVLIAFKTDNPGTWLMHCHIAVHASSGLGLQIMERQEAANEIWPPNQSNALKEANRVCSNWNSWAYDCRNQWPGNIGTDTAPNYPSCINAVELQNDSGF
ncbi:multicopper oxidase-domain-containing protein [Bisporella sp. PMI_857]|nr:multicopper oxidase-domain-containing protein [Bisporella sp. PMI_857]